LRPARPEEDALDETRALLERASEVWRRWGCPASGQCCQLATTGREPWLWPTEWQVLREALAAAGREVPAPRPDGGCRLLDAGGLRCSVYEARPSGCRTYFCERAEGPVLPGQRTHEVLDGLTSVNVALDPGCEPRSITRWLSGPP
jgi:hypothetical protein